MSFSPPTTGRRFPWVGEENKTLQSAKIAEVEHIPVKEDEWDTGDLEESLQHPSELEVKRSTQNCQDDAVAEM